jgi:hypothetical protein
MELQEQARRRKEEQAKREAETFITNPQAQCSLMHTPLLPDKQCICFYREEEERWRGKG